MHDNIYMSSNLNKMNDMIANMRAQAQERSKTTKILTGLHPWIAEMHAKKNIVIIAGRDIRDVLENEDSDVDDYLVRNMYPPSLWVMVVRTNMNTVLRGLADEVGDMDLDMFVNEYGSICHRSYEDKQAMMIKHEGVENCNGSICNSYISANTILHPGPNMWPTCNEWWKNDKRGRWYVSNMTHMGYASFTGANVCSRNEEYIDASVIKKIHLFEDVNMGIERIPYIVVGTNKIMYSVRQKDVSKAMDTNPDEYEDLMTTGITTEKVRKITFPILCKEEKPMTNFDSFTFMYSNPHEVGYPC